LLILRKGGRQRTNCCKISVPAPPPPPTCDYDVCNEVPALSLCYDDDDIADGAISKRESCPEFLESIGDNDYCHAEDSTLHSFEKRSQKKTINIVISNVKSFNIYSRPYLSRAEFIKNAKKAGRSFFVYLVQPVCVFFNVQEIDWKERTDEPPKKLDTEHIIDVSVP
jgi:hypothetical protein